MWKVGMPAVKGDRHYTYADLLSWPDDERWELIDGVAWNMSAAPNMMHQRICGKLFVRVATFLEGTSCTVWDSANVMFPRSPDQVEEEVDTVVEPDLFVVCDPAQIKEKYCTGAPDWIVEVLSPSTSRKDMRDKFNLYQREGVREYWIVDPYAQSIHVYRLARSGRYRPEELYIYREEQTPLLSSASPGPIASDVLQGFQVAMNDIFG